MHTDTFVSAVKTSAGAALDKLKPANLASRFRSAPNGVKVGIGLGLAAVTFVGAPAILPVAAAGVGYGAYRAARNKWGKTSCEMTPERRRVYEQALEKLKDPVKLRMLADEFEKAGCRKEADHLRKRAALGEQTPEQTLAARKLYRDALKTKDATKALAAAAYFKKIAADGAARHIEARVRALKAAG